MIRSTFLKGNRNGISMSEYAIIMALVVVIGIAALAMLGVNVNEMLGNILASGGKSANGLGKNPASTIPINVDQISTIQIVRGPNGKITYKVTLNTGAGSQVTSAPGDKVMLAMVKQMEAEIAKQEATGTLDPAVAAALKAFKDNMANYQSLLASYLLNKAQYDQEIAQIKAQEKKGNYSPPPYHSTEFGSEIFAQTEAFLNMNQSFQNLSSLIAGKPQYGDLNARVNEIAGMVSTVAISDQMTQTAQSVSANRINPAEIPSYMRSYPESISFLGNIQAQTAQQVAAQPGSNAYQKQFNQAFQNNVMATSTNQWMGSQDISGITAL